MHKQFFFLLSFGFILTNNPLEAAKNLHDTKKIKGCFPYENNTATPIQETKKTDIEFHKNAVLESFNINMQQKNYNLSVNVYKSGRFTIKSLESFSSDVTVDSPLDPRDLLKNITDNIVDDFFTESPENTNITYTSGRFTIKKLKSFSPHMPEFSPFDCEEDLNFIDDFFQENVENLENLNNIQKQKKHHEKKENTHREILPEEVIDSMEDPENNRNFYKKNYVMILDTKQNYIFFKGKILKKQKKMKKYPYNKNSFFHGAMNIKKYFV